jgi:hypothetical protein
VQRSRRGVSAWMFDFSMTAAPAVICCNEFHAMNIYQTDRLDLRGNSLVAVILADFCVCVTYPEESTMYVRLSVFKQRPWFVLYGIGISHCPRRITHPW